MFLEYIVKYLFSSKMHGTVHVMLFLKLNVVYFYISTERPGRDVDGSG
jgi:hypothetical protein